MRRLPTVGAALVCASMLLHGAQNRSDPAAELSEARAALGGDAVLAAVTSFTLNGSIAVTAANATFQAAALTFEIRSVLPDKFVRITHQGVVINKTSQASEDVAEWVGFNGTDPIRDTVSRAPGAGAGSFDEPPKTPEAKTAFRATQAVDGKRLFAAFTLPLFAASFSGFPIDFSSASSAKMGDRSLTALNGQDASGQPWRLFLDSTTHLPVMVTWMGRGVLHRADSGTTLIGGPTGDKLVTWRLELSDYAKSNGLNWPRRMKMYTEAQPQFEDIKLSRFALNPKIDPKTFTPTK